MLLNVTLGVVLVLSSVVSAVVALSIMSFLTRDRRPKASLLAGPVLERAIYLFENHELIDATEPARDRLATAAPSATDWDRLIAVLSPHFTGLHQRLAQIAANEVIELDGTGPHPLRLVAEGIGNVVRIEVIDPESEGQAIVVDALSNHAQEAELALLRNIVGTAPFMAWRYDASGAIDWANRVYIHRAAEHLGLSDSELTWPLPDLLPVGSGFAPGDVRRVRLLSKDTTRTQWYERRSVDTQQHVLHYAVPADNTVKAETALREFVQTLTKTFAHLPIGLAIFDRQRQLALFNPALIDLTTLGAEFLSSRPTLFSFLDNLREVRMIPEPKDYPTWRQTMTELEKAASQGHYEETWTLPTGQTYKIIGRPHPDGAVAFLFEDITAEISLTRRFRSELELGQDILDRMPEAIAVFSAAGTIMQSNAAYAALWGIDPQTALGEVGIADSLRHWQALSLPSRIWAEARDFVGGTNARAELAEAITMKDGRRVAARFVPMQGSLTLAGFTVMTDLAATPQVGRMVPGEAMAGILSA